MDIMTPPPSQVLPFCGPYATPMVDSFGKAELEQAAWILTKYLCQHGDIWGGVVFHELIDWIPALDLPPNPFFNPDFLGLVNRGFLDSIKTSDGRQALRVNPAFQARIILWMKHPRRWMGTDEGVNWHVESFEQCHKCFRSYPADGMGLIACNCGMCQHVSRDGSDEESICVTCGDVEVHGVSQDRGADAGRKFMITREFESFFDTLGVDRLDQVVAILRKEQDQKLFEERRKS